MLQLCDKGMLLFAEKYIQVNWTQLNDKEENGNASNEKDFSQLKDLICAIVMDDFATKDSIVVKKSISPTW
jgi:hypothetical protein